MRKEQYEDFKTHEIVTTWFLPLGFYIEKRRPMPPMRDYMNGLRTIQ